jgi:hypothetical protein
VFGGGLILTFKLSELSHFSTISLSLFSKHPIFGFYCLVLSSKWKINSRWRHQPEYNQKIKITLNIFKKVTSLHIKKSMKKNTFLALTNLKIKIFSKF